MNNKPHRSYVYEDRDGSIYVQLYQLESAMPRTCKESETWLVVAIWRGFSGYENEIISHKSWLYDNAKSATDMFLSAVESIKSGDEEDN